MDAVQEELGYSDEEMVSILRTLADEYARTRERRFVLDEFEERDVISYLKRWGDGELYKFRQVVAVVEETPPFEVSDLDGGTLIVPDVFRVRIPPRPGDSPQFQGTLDTVHPRMVTGHYEQADVEAVREWLADVSDEYAYDPEPSADDAEVSQ